MEVRLTLGGRMAVSWLLMTAEGYNLEAARHVKRVRARLGLNALGEATLKQLSEAEGAAAVFSLEQGDVVWLRDQVKARFDAGKFAPHLVDYGADLLDLLDEALKPAA